MKRLLSVLILTSALTAFSAPHPHHHTRPHHPTHRTTEPLPWQTIAAGGAAAGTVVAAYKISDGVEEGLKTVAKEEPEAFAWIVTPFAGPLQIITIAGLIYAGYRIWCWHQNKTQTTSNERNQNHEN